MHYVHSHRFCNALFLNQSQSLRCHLQTAPVKYIQRHTIDPPSMTSSYALGENPQHQSECCQPSTSYM